MSAPAVRPVPAIGARYATPSALRFGAAGLARALDGGEVDLRAARAQQRQRAATVGVLVADTAAAVAATPPRSKASRTATRTTNGNIRDRLDQAAKRQAKDRRRNELHSYAAATLVDTDGRQLRLGAASAAQFGAALRPLFVGYGGRRVEVAVVLGFDRGGSPVAASVIATGDATSVNFRLSDVVRIANEASATTLAIVHNHPGDHGHPGPSVADIRLEVALRQAAAAAGLEVAGSLILNEDTAAWSGDPRPRAARQAVAPVLDVRLGDGPAALGRAVAGRLGTDEALVVAFNDTGRVVAVLDFDGDLAELLKAGATRAVAACRRHVHAPALDAVRAGLRACGVKLIGAVLVSDQGGQWA